MIEPVKMPSVAQKIAKKVEQIEIAPKYIQVEPEYIAPPSTLKPEVKEYFDLLDINWSTRIDPDKAYIAF